MKKCQCCGDTKPSKQFSWNQKKLDRSPNCRDCNGWIDLLRQAFSQKPEGYSKRHYAWKNPPRAKQNSASNDLWFAWSESA